MQVITVARLHKFEDELLSSWKCLTWHDRKHPESFSCPPPPPPGLLLMWPERRVPCSLQAVTAEGHWLLGGAFSDPNSHSSCVPQENLYSLPLVATDSWFPFAFPASITERALHQGNAGAPHWRPLMALSYLSQHLQPLAVRLNIGVWLPLKCCTDGFQLLRKLKKSWKS